MCPITSHTNILYRSNESDENNDIVNTSMYILFKTMNSYVTDDHIHHGAYSYEVGENDELSTRIQSNEPLESIVINTSKYGVKQRPYVMGTQGINPIQAHEHRHVYLHNDPVRLTSIWKRDTSRPFYQPQFSWRDNAYTPILENSTITYCPMFRKKYAKMRAQKISDLESSKNTKKTIVSWPTDTTSDAFVLLPELIEQITYMFANCTSYYDTLRVLNLYATNPNNISNQACETLLQIVSRNINTHQIYISNRTTFLDSLEAKWNEQYRNQIKASDTLGHIEQFKQNIVTDASKMYILQMKLSELHETPELHTHEPNNNVTDTEINIPILAKEYISLDELEADNDKDVKFTQETLPMVLFRKIQQDAQYQGILQNNDQTTDIKAISYITAQLNVTYPRNNQEYNHDIATRLYTNKERFIKNGEYAVLNQNNSTSYYKRENNKWVAAPSSITSNRFKTHKQLTPHSAHTSVEHDENVNETTQRETQRLTARIKKTTLALQKAKTYIQKHSTITHKNLYSHLYLQHTQGKQTHDSHDVVV